MIQKYKTVSIIYGGKGRDYATFLNDKLTALSNKERYPIEPKIIMERVLTRELLSDVMTLFDESEFCVAFLTADDIYTSNDGGKKRLRQNVVFELGMALIQMGRERCILLSDFDVHSSDFELPSDMNSLEIRQFDSATFEETIDDVVHKILELSRTSVNDNVVSESIPQYDGLLAREKYYIDYENVFELPYTRKSSEGKEFLRETLTGWFKECEELKHFDEKAIYVFERIGFLPIYGHIREATDWLNDVSRLLGNYAVSDIEYYGDKTILDFVRNLVRCIIEYTQIKSDPEHIDYARYKRLITVFQRKELPKASVINPLIGVVYYDYLGLTYMKLYNGYGDTDYIVKAQEAFEVALLFAEKVDWGIEIWHGFISYNLARAYAAQEKYDEADRYYLDAIDMREDWLRTDKYNVIVRNALSSEYFIAKMDYNSMRKKAERLSTEEALREFDNIEIELNTYCDVEDTLEQLLYVRKLLNKLKSDL